ncbi:MAG: hypothetical protein ACJAQV_001698 [Loktanella salsilacus]
MDIMPADNPVVLRGPFVSHAKAGNGLSKPAQAPPHIQVSYDRMTDPALIEISLGSDAHSR